MLLPIPAFVLFSLANGLLPASSQHYRVCRFGEAIRLRGAFTLWSLCSLLQLAVSSLASDLFAQTMPAHSSSRPYLSQEWVSQLHFLSYVNDFGPSFLSHRWSWSLGFSNATPRATSWATSWATRTHHVVITAWVLSSASPWLAQLRSRSLPCMHNAVLNATKEGTQARCY